LEETPANGGSHGRADGRSATSAVAVAEAKAR
jgi:hypothetical protein